MKENKFKKKGGDHFILKAFKEEAKEKYDIKRNKIKSKIFSKFYTRKLLFV